MSEQDETVIDLGGNSTVGSSTTETATAGDTLVQGPEGRPRRRLAAYLAAGLVLVILAGVGAVVWWRMKFVGPQPAERMPSNLAAYVAIDLAPSARQQARLLALADKLPNLGQLAGRDLLSPAKIFDAVTGGSNRIDFARDIQPWLGVRVGVGVWGDERDGPRAIIAAASTDDAAARAGLTRLRDSLGPEADLGFVVENGVALIVLAEDSAQAVAQTARDEAVAHPFSESPGFQQARRWLGDDQVVVVWVDNGRYAGLVGQMVPGMTVGGAVPTGAATGASVLGITATGQGLEARFRSFGSAAAPPVPDALTSLGALPSESVIAAITRLPDNAFSPTGPLAGGPGGILSGMYYFGLLGMLSEADLGMPIGPVAGELTPAEQREVDALLSKDPSALTDAEQARLKELIGFVPSTGPDPGRKELSKAEQQELEALLSKDPSTLTDSEAVRLKELIGFDPNGPGTPFPPGENPLEDLSGATVTVAISSLVNQPALRAVIEMTSAEKASHFAANIKDEVGGLTVTVEGRTITGVTPGYSTGAGRLADRPEFQRALAGAPTGLSTAAYVDLRRAVPPANRSELAGLSAVALLIGADDGDQAGLIRLIIT